MSFVHRCTGKIPARVGQQELLTLMLTLTPTSIRQELRKLGYRRVDASRMKWFAGMWTKDFSEHTECVPGMMI